MGKATRITIAKIEAARIPEDKVEAKLWDSVVSGLCLRCFASGGKSWAYRYRAGGGRNAPVKTLKLGLYPAVGIEAARNAARAHAGLIAQGNDPAAVRRESRRRARSALGHLLEQDGAYQRSLEARNVVKRKVVLAVLRRGLARYMANDIAKLTRQDLVAAIDALEGLPGAQAELRKHARGLWEWSTNSGLTPANPLAGLRLPPRTRAQRLEKAARRRALDDDAIAAVWRAAIHYGRYGAMVQLALLSAMRRGELAQLRWDDIGEDRITLSPEITKMAAQHEIPLTDLMRQILSRQTRTTSPLVFPSDQTGGVLTNFSKLKRRLVSDANAGHFTLHDCRRSCRTLMDRLGVTEPTAELAIGHTRGGLIGLYSLDQKWEARVDAFERVSDHIAQLIGCSVPGSAQK